mmetsp:Transcript_10099/g.15255  ORF Transcript_10099/g.15255 Transcript_10099/m.15255 type:complete len:303 (-) Transcript_10099:241-1149(-)
MTLLVLYLRCMCKTNRRTQLKYVEVSDTYFSRGRDELSMKKGDVISVIEWDEGNDWWTGSLNGKTGIFPSSYVMETNKRPQYAVEALYDFDPENDDELPLKEGDIITVLNNLDSDWWLGELGDGRSGLIPSNYVQNIISAGDQPLKNACEKGDLDGIKKFLETNPDDIKTHFTNSFHTACQQGKLDIVKYLLLKHPYVMFYKSEVGDTGFHLACLKWNLSLVKLLISEDPTVIDVKNEEGDTGFHIACREGAFEIVKYLVNEDPSVVAVKNQSGETGREIAEKKYNNGTAQWLKKQQIFVFY